MDEKTGKIKLFYKDFFWYGIVHDYSFSGGYSSHSNREN